MPLVTRRHKQDKGRPYGQKVHTFQRVDHLSALAAKAGLMQADISSYDQAAVAHSATLRRVAGKPEQEVQGNPSRILAPKSAVTVCSDAQTCGIRCIGRTAILAPN